LEVGDLDTVSGCCFLLILSFAGFAKTAADSCYHQGCDSVANINFDEMLQNARRAAGVLSELANKADLTVFLENGAVPVGGLASVDTSVEDRCEASMVAHEPLCEKVPRTPRKPRWANKI
jgi:hypothetical protein